MKRVDFSWKIDVINGLQLCIDTFALVVVAKGSTRMGDGSARSNLSKWSSLKIWYSYSVSAMFGCPRS